MWCSDRRTFLGLLAASPLAGCGFAPVYGPGSVAGDLQNRLAFRAPDTAEGFRLRARLEDRLGRVERGDYLLVVELEIREVAIVITSSQDINRYNLPGIARWQLFEDGSDSAFASGRVETFTAYSAFGTTVASEEAREDARNRLAIALADLVITDLALRVQALP